ncbi:MULTISPECIES: TIGR03752 family integrating conjugative element protein [Pseudomonadota]|jgi:integrating conjugative element protein (TIGR03752 family)|uniref:Integrating conjugative element protein (TIGR03752 family) n=2 Tax=Pseudomonadota TaxID=1224 RepID=A0A366H892_9BURK|nr:MULTISPECIES: TIGR03752 family integrating conjugative element protein [Pseudomonadota]ABS65025.1 putative secreted protein [Parvibaculum lavamentivorans DS-1]MCC0186664.1 TIGR03752 family integrating conjugative element protein [Pseudomonas aeruginosa]MCI2810236.1 TIGR03752 family integrating conjugative element protein [Eoetvoesiella caeni]MCU9297308.1 TIGR03752 family integrating conjugative element protein [Pseudomonas aeruginosa]NYT54606.1 TIGR03752 family integrating conjugative eleme
MRSNGLLKWLMIPVALLVLFIGVRLFSGGGPSTLSQADAGSQLTPEEMKALGIEGDTPRDTVATLVAQVKQLRTELQTALSDNKSQREENQRLRQRENSIDQRINAALEAERSNLRRDQQQAASERQQTEGLLADLQRRLEAIGGRGGGHADLPVGLGLRDGDEAGMEGGVRWVEPDDAKKAEARGSSSGAMSFPTSFGPAQRTLETTAETVANAGARAAGVKTAKAVYTVPTNSTLMGSVAMTALIGRVPIDGTVNDPYPFKVLVGPDNLTANGIDIPDVAGAVFSGTASGDWTLSCVRGQVRSITFVFHDGTIRTIPEDREGNQQNNQQRDGLGWISDPYGIPCVSGERRSNAQQYLGSQALITAAGAGVASLIESDSGQMSYVGSDGSIGTVGISGQEAVGRILAGGVQEMSNWVNKLYGQAFAAVYVQPGAKVAVHLEKPLAIDFDPEGRKVDHRAGESHALELD